MFDCWGCNYLGGGIVELNEEAAGRSEGTGSIFPHIASPLYPSTRRRLLQGIAPVGGSGGCLFLIRAHLGGGGIIWN